MLLSVPGASSSDSFPGTVTRPGSTGCFSCRWLPRRVTSTHPSCLRIRSICLTFMRPLSAGGRACGYARIWRVCRITPRMSCRTNWRQPCVCKGGDSLACQLHAFVRRQYAILSAQEFDPLSAVSGGTTAVSVLVQYPCRRSTRETTPHRECQRTATSTSRESSPQWRMQVAGG